MTLIMAFNLTDRIIIAGDTKLTNSHTGETVGYCIKVLQFSDKEKKNFFSCAFAGNKQFALYIARRIDEALEKETLDTDINWLIDNIDSFLKQVTPEYEGEEKTKSAFMIFAGVSKNSELLKAFDEEAFSEVFGTEGGRVEDENLLFALQTGFVALPTREQKIFSYKIDSSSGVFELGKIGNVYSFLFGGSTSIEEGVQKQIRKIFLDKRDIKDEAKDVINLLRSKYSKTIGGAVTVGVIGQDGILKPVGYELDRSGKEHHTNWSIRYADNKILGISPTEEEIDLVEGFYKIGTSEASLEL